LSEAAAPSLPDPGNDERSQEEFWSKHGV
jgi:hypothetical protein